MKSFAQFICESSSDAFRLDDPIWKYFNSEKIKETLDYLDNYKCRATLIWISPDLFLKLARLGHDPYKEETVKKYAESTGLNDIPSLMFKDDYKGTAYITGHEGRHRARFFKEKGFKLIPVEFSSNRIRWGSQDNKFDHIDVWPTVLVSEDGVSKVPFPDSAIFPHKETETNQ